MKEIKWNINYYMKVKLTQAGIDELKRRHEERARKFPQVKIFQKPFELKLDKDGYYRKQGWVIMEELGHMCLMGGALPFSCNVIIEVDE